MGLICSMGFLLVFSDTSLISAQFHARLYNLTCFNSFLCAGSDQYLYEVESEVADARKRFAKWSHCTAFNDRRFPLRVLFQARTVVVSYCLLLKTKITRHKRTLKAVAHWLLGLLYECLNECLTLLYCCSFYSLSNVKLFDRKYRSCCTLMQLNCIIIYCAVSLCCPLGTSNYA